MIALIQGTLINQFTRTVKSKKDGKSYEFVYANILNSNRLNVVQLREAVEAKMGDVIEIEAFPKYDTYRKEIVWIEVKKDEK